MSVAITWPSVRRTLHSPAAGGHSNVVGQTDQRAEQAPARRAALNERLLR
jgi:hypothetical protein